MTVRRPIVLVDGKYKQLPDGDAVAGMPLVVSVGLASGTVERVPLDVLARLPVGLAGGGTVYVQAGA